MLSYLRGCEEASLMVESVGDITPGHLGAGGAFWFIYQIAEKILKKRKGDEQLVLVLKNQKLMMENQVQLLEHSKWLYDAHNQKDEDGVFQWMVRRSMDKKLDSLHKALEGIDRKLEKLST